MSRIADITINGLNGIVNTDPAAIQGIWASGMLFDEECDVVADSSSRLYLDYCDTCIAQLVLDDLMVGRRQITQRNIDDALQYDNGMVCTCED